MIPPLGYIQRSKTQICNQDDEGTNEEVVKFILKPRYRICLGAGNVALRFASARGASQSFKGSDEYFS